MVPLTRSASNPTGRRAFLGAALRAGAGAALAQAAGPPATAFDEPLGHFAHIPDLRRRFIFEYYPWYATDPVRHWEQWGRRPPVELAAHYMPQLGAYDSRSAPVLEQHARWMAETGAGAVNVSWWGPDSFEDRAVPLLMDIMRDHDLKVTFHLEPYVPDHSARFGADVLYLLRRYGEQRRFDALLLLRDASGRETPLFKGFRMVLPARKKDCLGQERPVLDHVPDDLWQRSLELLRRALRDEFDALLVLADTLDVPRARAGGFDGIAPYDNQVAPETYPAHARAASQAGLLFSFNVNPGYDGIEPRSPEACHEPVPFAPYVGAIDWSRAAGRERAAALARARIETSLWQTLEVQTDHRLLNRQRGFLLVYLNSFNEWHEGHAFEPMKDHAALTPEERRMAYRNPERGDDRLRHLQRLLAPLTAAHEGSGP